MDSLGDNAIEGMLSHLDPHSSFIPAVDLSEMNEDLQGNFEGIGIEFQIFDDTVNVMNVLADGPSDKAGLRVGDKFIKVGDSLVAGNGISNEKIRRMLRGPGASKVTISLLRAGDPGGLRQITISRGIIPLPSVDVAYMVNKRSAISVSIDSPRPPMRSSPGPMIKLQQQGMQRMILDLAREWRRHLAGIDRDRRRLSSMMTN
jgi:carboxyl-terminal processing protease